MEIDIFQFKLEQIRQMYCYQFACNVTYFTGKTDERGMNWGKATHETLEFHSVKVIAFTHSFSDVYYQKCIRIVF